MVSTLDDAMQPWEWSLDPERSLMVGAWLFSRNGTKLKFGLHIWPYGQIYAFQRLLALAFGYPKIQIPVLMGSLYIINNHVIISANLFTDVTSFSTYVFSLLQDPIQDTILH